MWLIIATWKEWRYNWNGPIEIAKCKGLPQDIYV
jgi:hypothetical protein